MIRSSIRVVSQKRPFLLLEVLIAIFLVSLCIIPLLSPYAAIFRNQQQLIDKIALDHSVHLLYADVIERLHNNAIPWQALNNGQPFPIETETLHQLSQRPLPWRGEYRFGKPELKPKEPKDNEPFILYLADLTFSFKPLPNRGLPDTPIEYTYKVFLARQLPGAKAEKKDDKKSAKSTSKKADSASKGGAAKK